MLLPIFALLLFNLPIAISQSPECGSLITFRQFDELLTTAPSCLRSGCQPTTPQLAMTSSCPSPSPCHAFWDLLRQEWQQNWCDTCSQDIACRIGGWPILNSTSACASSPNEWLFSNAAGGCCASGQEPFELAAWAGVLCNGSEWREPFDYYAGMARDDWVEWLQPWNWTVHMQNETGRNFTQVACDSAKGMLMAFLIDNFVSLGEAALELFVYWVCCICAWNVVMEEVKTMRRSLLAGLTTGGLYLVSNFATSIMWDLMPGYSHIPRGFVGLLLCARPSSLGFLSLLAIVGRGRVARTIATDADELRQQREESRLNTPRVKAWRKTFGSFLRMFERGDRRNRPVTDEDLADGRETAKQLLAGFALTIGVSELVLQVSSVYSIFKTATVGGSKGFLSRYALLPFYQGYSASLMYGGALLHCVFLFPSTLGLVLIAWSHAKEQKYREWRRYLDANERRNRKLQNYYTNRPAGHDLTDDERAQARYMYQEQRAFERSLLPRQRPGFWKRTWIRVQRLFSPRPAPIPPPPPPEKRGFLHKIRVKLTLAVTRPLNNLIEEANAAHELGDPERGDPERGDLERGDPERGDPERGDPERGDPERGDPERGDPGYTAPEPAAPGFITPEPVAFGPTAAELTGLEPTAPEPTAFEPAASELAAPEHTAFEPAASELAAPELTAPEPTAPGIITPEPTALGLIAPGVTAPEPTAFEPTAFEPTAFEPTAFEPTAFEPTAFEPTAFERTAPGPAAPEPTAPELAALEPTAPGFIAPGFITSEPVAPGLITPESTAFEPAALRFTAPEPAAPELADPEAGPTDTADDGRPPRNQAIRRLRRLAGRALSVRFLRTRITRSFTRANEEETRRREEREEQERGPDQERFNQLVLLHQENLETDEEKRRNRHASRSPAFIFTFLFVSMNYTSQWLFWAGYVETAGERWCPPNEEFNIEKGIWAAIAAVALLVSVILSSSTDSGQAPAA